MTRQQAERERERLALEQPDSTWLISEDDGSWRVLKVGVPPVEAPTGTEITAKPKPPHPDSPPTPNKAQVHPYWGAG